MNKLAFLLGMSVAMVAVLAMWLRQSLIDNLALTDVLHDMTDCDVEPHALDEWCN